MPRILSSSVWPCTLQGEEILATLAADSGRYPGGWGVRQKIGVVVLQQPETQDGVVFELQTG